MFDFTPRLERSEVEGIPYAGEDFMRTVFQLGEGEVAVTANDPQTVYYVVRMVHAEPSLDLLREEFKIRDEMDPSIELRREIQKDRWRNWLQRIEQETGFRWVRDPHSDLGVRVK